MADYDIVTVGGGLGGAAIARAMAERGYKVLVTERETKFKDRGEAALKGFDDPIRLHELHWLPE